MAQPKRGKKKSSSIKITPIDKIFSECIRERDAWTCRRCKRYYSSERRGGLHCSHIFSRRHRILRWHPDNAVAHCMGCHTFLGGNPVEFTAWAREELGEEVLEALGAKLRIITRYRHSDLAEIRDHYRDQFKELKNQRERGKTGILTLPVAPVLLRA